MTRLPLMMILSLALSATAASVGEAAPRDAAAGGECSDAYCSLFEVRAAQKQVQQASASSPLMLVGDDGAKKPTRGIYTANGMVTCYKSVVVPRAVFHAVTRIIGEVERRGLATSGDGPPPTLSDTEKVMMLFYVTAMQQTSQFTCQPASAGDIPASGRASAD